MAGNVPKKGEETDTQVQEAQRVPYEKNKAIYPRHVIIKIKSSRILKTAREKKTKKTLLTYKGTSVGLSAEFSAETLQVRRE